MQQTLGQLINEAAGVTYEQTPIQSQEQTPPTEGDKTPPVSETTPPVGENQPQVSDNVTPPASDGQTPPAEDKIKPNPMKELRDKYNQTQKDSEFRSNTMEKFYNGDYKFSPKDFKTEDGKIDYQALNKAMEDADNEALAKTKGITPEIQAEITRIENEKIELKKQQLKVAMDRGLADMQVELQLDRAAVNQFFSDSMAVQKNPYQWLAQGGSLKDLYNLVYHDKILKEAVDKAVAEAKTKWESERNIKPPTANPASPTPDTPIGNGLTLNDMINEAIKK